MKDIQVNKQLPVLTMNFEEVKSSLEETINKYRGIVVTEESLKDCKATQRDLSKLGKDIDTYRKGVKKEMEAPIKAFEVQCKELIQMVDEANKPIKAGIEEFDNKKRIGKITYAKQIIALKIVDLGLESKFAEKLMIDSSYGNLTTTKKFIKDDISIKAEQLKQQQDQEKQRMELIKNSVIAAVEGANQTINTKLKADDFFKYIDMGYDLAQCINQVNKESELVRRTERAEQERIIAQQKAEEEKELLKQQKVEENVETTEVKPVESPVVNITQNARAADIPKEGTHFYIDVVISHDKEHMVNLSQYLNENGFKYSVKSKGRLKQ